MYPEVKSLLIAATLLGYVALVTLIPFSYGLPFLFQMVLASGFTVGVLYSLFRK
jgi:hypothetical protein